MMCSEYSMQIRSLEENIHHLTIEFDSFKRIPPKVITKVEKVVEHVEVIPHDYEEIKYHLTHLTEEYEKL